MGFADDVDPDQRFSVELYLKLKAAGKAVLVKTSEGLVLKTAVYDKYTANKLTDVDYRVDEKRILDEKAALQLRLANINEVLSDIAAVL